MKFVFCGYDFTIDIPKRLIEGGHDLIAIFTFECDNVFNFNTALHELARARKIPISQNKITPGDIDHLIAQGCECFLAAGYLHKIPDIDETKAYGLNVHPSLLPKGRGLMPVPYILMDHPEAAGLTIHKLSLRFDGGDIVLQTALKLHPHETVETYAARLGMIGPDMTARIFADFKTHWAQAKPQDESKALHFPPPDEHMRMLDFHQDVATIDRKARAFGRFGSLAVIENALWVIYDHDVWTEEHSHAPGKIVAQLQNALVISAKNGFVCLKECHKINLAL